MLGLDCVLLLKPLIWGVFKHKHTSEQGRGCQGGLCVCVWGQGGCGHQLLVSSVVVLAPLPSGCFFWLTTGKAVLCLSPGQRIR